jgi:hypothetical protein
MHYSSGKRSATHFSILAIQALQEFIYLVLRRCGNGAPQGATGTRKEVTLMGEQSATATAPKPEMSFSLDASEQELLEEFGVLALCEYCYAVT